MIKDYGKISVIMPMYNVSEFVKRAIASVRNQTYKNLEVIIINDGSTDDSLEVATNAIDGDERFIIINQENNGVSAARNLGLENCTGEFIAWLDPDDYIEPLMYEIMINNLIQNNADMVMCNFYQWKSPDTKVFKDKTRRFPSIMDFVNRENYFLCMYQMSVFLWNKLSRKNVFQDVIFPDTLTGEDYVVKPQVLKNITRMAFVDEALYNYTKYRNTQITANVDDSKLLASFEVRKNVYLASKDENPPRAMLVKHFRYRIYRKFHKSAPENKSKFMEFENWLEQEIEVLQLSRKKRKKFLEIKMAYSSEHN